MSADPCLPGAAQPLRAAGSTAHHHAIHHVVGRIRHRVHHAPVPRVAAPEHAGDACGKHFTPDRPVAAKAKIGLGAAKAAAGGLLAASALAGSLAASGLLGAPALDPRPSTNQAAAPVTAPSGAGLPYDPASSRRTDPATGFTLPTRATPVPEPGSLPLLLAAIGAVVSARVATRSRSPDGRARPR